MKRTHQSRKKKKKTSNKEKERKRGREPEKKKTNRKKKRRKGHRHKGSKNKGNRIKKNKCRHSPPTGPRQTAHPNATHINPSHSFSRRLRAPRCRSCCFLRSAATVVAEPAPASPTSPARALPRPSAHLVPCGPSTHRPARASNNSARAAVWARPELRLAVTVSHAQVCNCFLYSF